jgi:Na+-transporting NADH:ubiquinone oxidoreductase subunit NqrC
MPLKNKKVFAREKGLLIHALTARRKLFIVSLVIISAVTSAFVAVLLHQSDTSGFSAKDKRNIQKSVKKFDKAKSNQDKYSGAHDVISARRSAENNAAATR